MYNKCDVFVCGHKWKCNSTETDSLFSFHEYYRALHPYVPFHFLYFISVCWCYTVSWMQDRYCTKLYCYWLKNVIKSCLRSLLLDWILNLQKEKVKFVWIIKLLLYFGICDTQSAKMFYLFRESKGQKWKSAANCMKNIKSWNGFQ